MFKTDVDKEQKLQSGAKLKMGCVSLSEKLRLIFAGAGDYPDGVS